MSQRLKRLCEGPPPVASLVGVMLLGSGVAYRVQSEELLSMREELADAFRGLLTPQDQAGPRLHITVQNKVTTQQARTLAEELRGGFRPRPIIIAGLAAWHYRGGPWELAMKTSFRGGAVSRN